MSKSYQWQLMTTEELAVAYIKDNGAFRRIKTHYKKRNNAIMSARLELAETLAKACQKGQQTQDFQSVQNG